MVVHEPMRVKFKLAHWQALTEGNYHQPTSENGYANSIQVGWTLDPCTRLVSAPFNMFTMVDIYTVYHSWRSDGLKPLSKRHSFTTDYVVRFQQVNPLVKTKLRHLDAFPYLKIPMRYVVIWGKVAAQTKLHRGCGLECSDTTDTTKKFETPTP